MSDKYEPPTFLTPGVWYDPEQAACAAAVALGLYRPPGRTFGPAKWVFATGNPVGDALAALIDALAHAGVLERGGDHGDEYWLRTGYTPDQFADIPDR